MASFTTAKGTVLALMDLRGKLYLPVAQRLIWFREDHPTWGIKSEFLKLEETYALAKVSVLDEANRILAEAHQDCARSDFADFVAKAETSALGRCLSYLGYGTQWADEIDEGARISDSPQERKRPVTVAVDSHAAYTAPEYAAKSYGDVVVPFGRDAGKPIKLINPIQLLDNLNYWEKRLASEGKPANGQLSGYLTAIREHLKEREEDVS